MKAPIAIHTFKTLSLTAIMSLIASCSSQSTDNSKPSKASENPWANAYNEQSKERFIPVELFTGATWDGKHELKLAPVENTACAQAIGRNRPCDKYHLTGPFTAKNQSKIAWVGEEIKYYKRTFSTPRGGPVESHFTVNNSKDGLVRVYDKRKRWGERRYDGLGSKFPLGYWKQGEVRHYKTRAGIRIEILELNGPDNCLTFRWTIGEGRNRNDDNVYTFCPGRGFSEFRNYE